LQLGTRLQLNGQGQFSTTTSSLSELSLPFKGRVGVGMGIVGAIFPVDQKGALMVRIHVS
jgi:hypothetical protein